MDSNSKEVLKTMESPVTLVDDLTGDEIDIKNTATINEKGEIVDFSSEVVGERKAEPVEDDLEELGESEEEFYDDIEDDFGDEDKGGMKVLATGSPILTSATVKEIPTMEEALSDLGEAISTEEEKVEFTAEDIKASLKDSMFTEGKPDFTLPDEDVVVILDIVEKVRKKENINIYAALPQSVKYMINKYMFEQGVQGYSVQANSVRNMLASTLIDEFISNISINKTVESFNKEMEDLFVKTGEEFSKMYKEYDTERTKYLEAALEKIPEGDPKRETITKVLDAINDAYKLTRLREATPKLKIKNFDREKPERTFSDFEFKYKDTQYHIYSIKQVLSVLYKHIAPEIEKTLPDDMDEEKKHTAALALASVESVDFMLLFCKFCMNYKADVPEEHAFMYYTLYNIMLLDVYKGEEYNDFANGFVNNIIEAYKPYYKKTMSEENFNKRFG